MPQRSNIYTLLCAWVGCPADRPHTPHLHPFGRSTSQPHTSIIGRPALGAMLSNVGINSNAPFSCVHTSPRNVAYRRNCRNCSSHNRVTHRAGQLVHALVPARVWTNSRARSHLCPCAHPLCGLTRRRARLCTPTHPRAHCFARAPVSMPGLPCAQSSQ